MGKGLTVQGELVEVPDGLFDIVGEIESRWPNLWVQYCNPDHATSSKRVGPALGDAPFRIMERTQGGPVVVMTAWKLDQAVIDRLHLLNSANVDVLAEIDKANAKLRKDMETEREESFSEAADTSKVVLKHFAAGKVTFNYTNDAGEKRIIREGYNGPRKVVVL